MEAFRQHKSDGLTADRIDSTMLNMEEVISTIYFIYLFIDFYDLHAVLGLQSKRGVGIINSLR